MNDILEYIQDGISINGNPIDGYIVFTIPTQHFSITSLDELNDITFKAMILRQKELNQNIDKMFTEYFSK
jgi:hypothetical protein